MKIIDKKSFKVSTCIRLFVILVATFSVNAAVYNYTDPWTFGGPDLGVWSGDVNGNYAWQKVEEHTGSGYQLTRMLGHDKMLWAVGPVGTYGYADPDPANYYYFLPQGQHEVCGAKWFAPAGEVVTKIEFNYAGSFGAYASPPYTTGFPQFSIYGGTTTPGTLQYMSALDYSSWTPVPFELTFTVFQNITAIQLNVWDLSEGTRIDDGLGADFEAIKITTAPAAVPQNCEDVWAAGHGMLGDINKDCVVDFKDLISISDAWLSGNTCQDMPEEGVTTYSASTAPAIVTIDGDLSEWPAFDYDPASWCHTNWVKIDKDYYDFPLNYSNAYMCMMYSASEDVIYAAVMVDDSDPVYRDINTSWNGEGQDNIEVFIQGNYYNRVPTNPLLKWSNAQHMAVGLANDLTTTWALWATGVPFGGYSEETGDPGIIAQVVRTAVGGHDHVVYEMKLIPYDNYGGIDGTTTLRTDIVPGSKLGFDITLSVKSSGYFGMACANTMAYKYNDITKYSLLICE